MDYVSSSTQHRVPYTGGAQECLLNGRKKRDFSVTLASPHLLGFNEAIEGTLSK